MKVSVHLRTGDWAILAGVTAIAVYEKLVHDDDDLISCRVAAYCRRAPVLTHAVILVTALHLLGWIEREVDPYVLALEWVRPARNPIPD